MACTASICPLIGGEGDVYTGLWQLSDGHGGEILPNLDYFEIFFFWLFLFFDEVEHSDESLHATLRSRLFEQPNLTLDMVLYLCFLLYAQSDSERDLYLYLGRYLHQS